MAAHGLPAWPWTGAAPEELPPPEALLLDALRGWARARRLGHPAAHAIALPLATADLAEAAPALDQALRLCTSPGELGCPLCPRLVGAEPALLLAFALAQRGPRREALAAFLRLVPPPSAYAALGHALAVMIAFRRAGLWLENPVRRPASATRPF
ncbi:hypothetical protein LPC08_02115 [Roseomonas sp. OT10]|uniref:hypothetical protein n=1 Tax=Roseomonas cutis TaxID=2897332 RepID=UPI001E3E46FE|nr:hypothetical protein [Roseomonas sp. OT10]UFN49464.1 hypothetical protein LPC08_02115 [Roseomonas sp. OT10]